LYSKTGAISNETRILLEVESVVEALRRERPDGRCAKGERTGRKCAPQLQSLRTFRTRPRGIMDLNFVLAASGAFCIAGVSMGPGLSTFIRMRRSFKSINQLRANEQSAALLPP
jgi:hypothetical protein